MNTFTAILFFFAFQTFAYGTKPGSDAIMPSNEDLKMRVALRALELFLDTSIEWGKSENLPPLPWVKPRDPVIIFQTLTRQLEIINMTTKDPKGQFIFGRRSRIWSELELNKDSARGQERRIRIQYIIMFHKTLDKYLASLQIDIRNRLIEDANIRTKILKSSVGNRDVGL